MVEKWKIEFAQLFKVRSEFEQQPIERIPFYRRSINPGRRQAKALLDGTDLKGHPQKYAFL